MFKNDFNKIYTQKNTKLDFIATAISHWHAMGIDAFVYDLKNKNQKKVRGIILIKPFFKDGFVINETDFKCNAFADVNFYFDDTNFNKGSLISRILRFVSKHFNIILGMKNLIRSNAENSIYLVYPLHPYFELIEYFKDKKLSNKYSPVFVLIDEGFGSYTSKKNGEFMTRFNSTSLIKSFLLIKFGNFINILKKIILKFIIVEDRFLFSNNGYLEVNDNIRDSYREVLKIRKNNFKVGTGKKILIITQPFSELNQISTKKEFQLMESLVKLLNKKGIKPILKPHPGEIYNKYCGLNGYCQLTESNFPVEDLILVLNPICVIGYTSTALLNSKIFYDITAVSLSNLLLSVSNSEALNFTTEEFKKLTSDYIEFLDKIEDIELFI